VSGVSQLREVPHRLRIVMPILREALLTAESSVVARIVHLEYGEPSPHVKSLKMAYRILSSRTSTLDPCTWSVRYVDSLGE